MGFLNPAETGVHLFYMNHAICVTLFGCNEHAVI